MVLKFYFKLTQIENDDPQKISSRILKSIHGYNK